MLIVDGDGVPSPRRPWHARGASARFRLVVDLARMTRDWDACVDVVFGGAAPPRFRDGSVVLAIRVWFAPEPRERVLDLASDAPLDEPTLVATSDRELALRAARTSAHPIAGETLRLALDRVLGPTDLGLHVRTPLVEGPRALLGMESARQRLLAARALASLGA